MARAVRPVVPATQRFLPVGGELRVLFPEGGVRRGSVVALDGAPGAGVTTLALRIAAAVTSAGEWAAVVDPDGTLGGRAAAEEGAVLERLAVVRRVSPARWATVVAALLDGLALVAATVPAGLRPADARRLAARARERGAVLVPVGSAPGAAAGPRAAPIVTWPAEAALRLRAEGSAWSGLGAGTGLLVQRTLRVRVEGRGATRFGTLARAG